MRSCPKCTLMHANDRNVCRHFEIQYGQIPKNVSEFGDQ